MNIPPLPTPEQLSQVHAPPTPKLGKRNIKIAIRLLEGQSIGTVGKAYKLSEERTVTIALEAFALLKQKLLSEEQRKDEFASAETNVRLTDYRQPERAQWWLQVLRSIVDQAPLQATFMLDKRPSIMPTYSRVR